MKRAANIRQLTGAVLVATGLAATVQAVSSEASAQAVQPKAAAGAAAKAAPAGAAIKPGTKAVATVAPIVTPPLPIRNPRREGASATPAAGEVTGPAAAPAQKTGDPPTLTPGAGGTSGSATDAGAAPAAATPAATIAKPEPMSPEAQYMARLDELIAPVRDFSPSVEDIKRIKEAIRLNGGGDQAGAKVLRAQITDPAGRRLAEWLALKGGTGDAQDMLAFVAQNPAWPERALIVRRAEEQVFTSGGNVQKIKDFFKNGEPKTGAGWAALASAYLAEGEEEKARQAAARTWRDFELAASLEQGFLERFGKLLTEADHRRRFDRILVDEVRFSAERSDRAAIASRIIPLLPEGERRKAEARLAIFLRARNAAVLLGQLPTQGAAEATDWGLAFQKVQHFRRIAQHEEAWKIIKSAPTDPELITSPDDWWSERRGAAHEAIRQGKPELAYELVRDAGPLSVNPLKDQTFMAGWIAFRLLGKADVALKHFEASRAAADGPLSRARADYWWGRSLEVSGQAAEARKRYASAAKDPDTFHGLLGRQKIDAAGGAPVDIRAGEPRLPTAEEAQRFNELDAVRAAVIAAKIGLDRNIVRALFGHLRNHLATEGEMAMLAHLGGALGDTQTSLRVGKTGIARGMNLIMYAYPLHAFPAYSPLRDPPEPAFLLGIARQESEFNSAIVSSAGARGMLQVMPVTAQHICRDHKIKCDIPRLLTDNSYNAMIASAYIGDRMAEFRGNYVLTLAGYNAGPGRARGWIRDFGDPRDASVDPIDWIERIPIEETREYVKKVLSNIQVYRARLGDQAALRLEQDLTRTIGGRRPASRADSGDTK